MLAAFFLGIVAGGILGGIGVLLDGGDTKGPGLLIGSFIGQWVVWVGAAVLASRRFGTGSLRRDVDWRIDKSDVLLGLGVAVAGLLATILVQQVLSAISKDFVGSNTSFVEDQAGTAIGSVIVGLSTMIGAPIVEELFFRGLLQHSLARFRVAAVVVQGLVFGLVHVTPGEGLGNVGIVAGLATFGMVLGFSVRQTRRLGTSMVAHGIFNAIAVIPILLR